MEREKIRAQVIEDLKSYPELKKKVVLLRYELDHPAKISDGEVIDSMALSRPVSDGIRPAGYISDKTMRIAVQFRDRKERLNQENIMEIERKWMVNGWPEGLPLKEEFAMRQGYISVRPTVRIREEALKGGETAYILCFKSGSGLAREEIERPIDKKLFDELETKIIGKPLIGKIRRSYALPDGLVLEVNHVDEGQPTAFWYAEVEYPTVDAARSWKPEAFGLADYLNDDVTDQPGQSMGAYWEQTRA